MRVVVVGATGNVGTAMLRRLAGEPQVTEIVGVVRRPPAPGAGPPYDRAEWAAVDLSAAAARPRLGEVFAGADAVVHLAWQLQPTHDVEQLERVNVEGSRAVVDAALDAGVPQLVYASSIGAYAPSPGAVRRDESWSTTGIPTSTYSRQKAAVERILDGVEPGRLRVARIRPAIVLQPDAAAEIARYFLGPLVPRWLLRPGRLPVLPWPHGLRLQVVHAADLADAFVRALLAGLEGGLNVATEPVLDRSLVAGVLRARAFDVPAGQVRALVWATWRARLQPTDPGWLDMAEQAPLMDTGRARDELGWTPTRPADATLTAFLAALADRRGAASPVLHGRGA